ncbi:cupin-like domain-containing protein [Aliiglaciecola sp. LCG003]|uniref:cupin-like domain-containing protein n=1 Tax=Aliiglaciecola sp. LCG003 TaxID=3053655 RepID=UPI0025724A4A|nr:cupin-like domain-containing protein [Aliiglaciecola sp. LCG003]WJG10126.1 cupin-like domain-containing protein [Aliiglaciecola sp. LCG003]
MKVKAVSAIREIHQATPDDLTQELLAANQPVVFRGLVKHWPLVQKSLQSDQSIVDYLRGFSNQQPVQSFSSDAINNGRYFYNAQLDGFNFAPKTSTLEGVIEDVLLHCTDNSAPTTYLGSTALEHILPGVRQQNPLAPLEHAPLVSLWLGNQSRIAAHYDIPDNLACTVAGRRRFTLFPPDQIDNLYVGPIDFTPAGQSASLVDFQQPDFQRFPKFKLALEQAQVAELEPGDAIFIPSMWWHHVESLAKFNLLVNYWWRQVPNYLGSPMDALNHALLSIRDLPESQRHIWRDIFEHYVFSAREQAHIPELQQGVLKPLDEAAARRLRATLINKLNR